MAGTSKPSPDEAEARMRGLLREAGLPEPDEVVHDAGHDELVFQWRDRKLVVVVELGNA
jgi:hypothetical protein